MANGNSSSQGGLVVGALVVGGVVGFLIGQAVEHSKKPGSTPSWTTASCLGSGNKNIQVVSSAPGCIEAEMWAATDQISWQSPPGTSLWIVFHDPKIFKGLTCNANVCEAHLPGQVDTTTNPGKRFEYDAIVYTKQTPTPAPRTPTPTPRVTYGRIIIKP